MCGHGHILSDNNEKVMIFLQVENVYIQYTIILSRKEDSVVGTELRCLVLNFITSCVVNDPNSQAVTIPSV